MPKLSDHRPTASTRTKKAPQPRLDALTSTEAWTFSRASDEWHEEQRRIFPSVGAVHARADEDRPGFLFYEAALNMLFGGSGTAKTWIALTVSLQQVRAGRRVIFLDYEGTKRSTVARLRSIGATEEEASRFVYVSCQGPFGTAEQGALDAVAADASVIFIDTAGESIGAEGRKSNDDTDLILWRRDLPLRYSKAGLCVVEIDHTGVSTEAQTRAAGGHRKKGGITGIQVQAVRYTGFDHKKGQLGKTKLICRKDREGTYAEDELVAVFTHEDDANGQRGDVGLWTPTEKESTVTGRKGQGKPRHIIAAEAMVKLGIEDDSNRAIVAALALQKIKVSRDTVALAKEHLKLTGDEQP